ncbi:MAG: methyltransferase domain-containing protein [Gammaproteobacteria bacterium]|nr:methyltransferase domain-containing protein [Gammaproteobacteria bacterium]
MTDWDARFYRQHTGFVSDLGLPVVQLLAPRTGERVLDVGCGDGILTVKLVEMGCDVVGIDASPDMVAAARQRGVDARLLDAVDLVVRTDFAGSFDAVFSNAALHWMRPMEAVVRGIAGALKPSGRFVAEFGGHGNIERIRRAIHQALDKRGIAGREVDPWHFPTSEEFSALLTGSGFDVAHIERFERPTDLPSGIANWMGSVGRPFLDIVPDHERQDFLAELEDLLAGELRRDNGSWWADYVRLRVHAVREPLP